MSDPIVGIDYSWARPGGAAIAAAGYRFAMRYVPYPGHQGKGLSIAERDDLHAHGIAIGLVFESTANRPLGGYDAGVYDATATIEALESLSWPPRPVYFAVDFDIQPAQLGALTAYMRGVGSVLGVQRVGVYGGIRALEHCRDHGLATWYWQALAWSGGRAFPGRHLYQYLNGQTLAGGEIDLNAAYTEDYGQWAGEEQVTREEYDALLRRIEDIELGVWSGSEEKDATGVLKSRTERLEAAAYRRDAIAAGNAQSIGERATSALIRPPATIPPHEHDLPAARTGGVSQ